MLLTAESSLQPRSGCVSRVRKTGLAFQRFVPLDTPSHRSSFSLAAGGSPRYSNPLPSFRGSPSPTIIAASYDPSPVQDDPGLQMSAAVFKSHAGTGDLNLVSEACAVCSTCCVLLSPSHTSLAWIFFWLPPPPKKKSVIKDFK